MGEADKSKGEQEDPADVLAEMAEGRDQDVVAPQPSQDAPDPPEALDQLAAEGADPADGLKDLAEGEGDEVDSEMAELTGLSGRQALQARRARGSKLAGQQARAHAHTYKKTMIPLLLVVGAMLILIGLVDVSMLVAAEEADRQTRWHALMTALAVVSFPLGAILFFGAWWFHRDVSR